MKTNKLLTIPNFLSLYRLLTFPVIAFLGFEEHQDLFALLLCINLLTDILDGFIARTFDMETAIGARLDSLADIGTYILAIYGLIAFKWDVLEPHLPVFLAFLGFYAATLVFSFVKFRKFTSFHLYSSKIGGYLQGSFFLLVFIGYFNVFHFYFVMIWGILSFTEHLLIQLIIPRLRSNLKGLYWVLKDQKLKVQ